MKSAMITIGLLCSILWGASDQNTSYSTLANMKDSIVLGQTYIDTVIIPEYLSDYISIISAPEGLIYFEISGTILWKPAMNQTGQHNIIIMTSNSLKSDTFSFTITVTEPNESQLFSQIEPSGDTLVFKNDIITLKATLNPTFFIYDSVSYMWFKNGEFVAMGNELDSYSFETNCSSIEGAYEIKVMVIYGSRHVNRKWIINVQERESTPIPFLPLNGSIITGNSLIGWLPAVGNCFTSNINYTIQLSTSPTFSQILYENDTLKNSALLLHNIISPSTLTAGTIIFWRVMCSDDMGRKTEYSDGTNYFVFMGLETSSEISEYKVMNDYALIGSSPNPFNPTTNIVFIAPTNIDVNHKVSLNIYDINGREVRTLSTAAISRGKNNLLFDGKDNIGQNLSAGVYMLKMRAGKYQAVEKIILAR